MPRQKRFGYQPWRQFVRRWIVNPGTYWNTKPINVLTEEPLGYQEISLNVRRDSENIILSLAQFNLDNQRDHTWEVFIAVMPMGMSQVALARMMGVPVQRINTLINGKRDMTAETAILLSRVLRTSSEFWMNLQATFDLYRAARSMDAA